MNAVGYSSPFVPVEWIAAHGLRPERIRLRPTEKLTRGICPYAGALMDAALAEKGTVAFCATHPEGRSGKRCLSPFPPLGLVLTTACDQMRYVAAMLERRGDRSVFLLNVPSTWQTPAARQLYLGELRRLGRFLVSLGGTAPSDAELAEVMLASNRVRDENGENSRGPTARGAPGGIPLAILGGPLLETDNGFFEMVERAGGRIVLDATEHGQRALPRPFDPARVAAGPLEELADAYFDGIPDAFRRPNTKLYEWLARELAVREVRGIILHRYVWCDLWHAEAERLREWAGVPLLVLESGNDATPQRTRTAIEAFLEALR